MTRIIREETHFDLHLQALPPPPRRLVRPVSRRKIRRFGRVMADLAPILACSERLMETKRPKIGPNLRPAAVTSTARTRLPVGARPRCRSWARARRRFPRPPAGVDPEAFLFFDVSVVDRRVAAPVRRPSSQNFSRAVEEGRTTSFPVPFATKRVLREGDGFERPRPPFDVSARVEVSTRRSPGDCKQLRAAAPRAAKFPRRHASARRTKSVTLRLRACVQHSREENSGNTQSRRVAADSACSYSTRPFQSLGAHLAPERRRSVLDPDRCGHESAKIHRWSLTAASRGAPRIACTAAHLSFQNRQDDSSRSQQPARVQRQLSSSRHFKRGLCNSCANRKQDL